MFRGSGITWSSSGNCSDRNNSTCTSFDQLNLATAQGAQTLKGASGCALNITGGTETGHASGTYSHWNGYKLDFGKNTCITSYVKNSFTYIGLVLYTRYVYFFQAAGVVLLVAMIGAIVLTLRHKPHVKRQNIAEQIARTKATAIDLVKVRPGQGL